MIYQRLAKVFLICSGPQVERHPFSRYPKFEEDPLMGLQNMIRRAIEIGHRTGFITFDQLNELVGTDKIEPEDIETLMKALSAEGIQVIDE
jgi:RNA polymerase primary sigma factor